MMTKYSKEQDSNEQDSKEQDRFIRFPELQKMLGGVSRAKIERDVANGILPAPFKLGKRMVAWKYSDVKVYMNSLQRVPADSYTSRVRKNRRTN